MFLKFLTLARSDTRLRDQRDRHWLPGSLIHGFVACCWTGAKGLVGGAVILKTDPVVLEECRAFHNGSLATAQLRSGCTAIDSTMISAASCSRFGFNSA